MSFIINFFLEIYKFLFISSIIFMIYILFDLGIKIYGRFKIGRTTKFVLTINEKIILWLSITIFLSYLI